MLTPDVITKCRRQCVVVPLLVSVLFWLAVSFVPASSAPISVSEEEKMPRENRPLDSLLDAWKGEPTLPSASETTDAAGEVTRDAEFQEPSAPAGQTGVRSQAPALESSESQDSLRIDVLSDFDDAVTTSQLKQRPLLVLLGAEWCSWCRKMEAELAGEEAGAILKRWVVVTVDVDDHPDIANRMNADALPALRILGLNQAVVASDEGYMPLSKLQEWLTAHLSQADPAIHRVLYDVNSPTDEDLQQLVAFLADRDSQVRNAAQQRLIRAKSRCAGLVADVLRTGGVAQKLSAIEILRRWHAPVGSLDPWQPESLDAPSLAPLLSWLQDQADSEAAVPGGESCETPSASRAEIRAAVDRLLKTTDGNLSSPMAEVVELGEAVADEVRTRLAMMERLPDPQRRLLREILYRVLAGDQTRLEKSALLSALASLDPETHRAAATTILAAAQPLDQPLVDQLSQDHDPLVRELTVHGFQAIGALQDKERLERLLGDTSPSVRTAVLREISENPQETMVRSLTDYLFQETDEDLLIYATKALGRLGNQPQSLKALANLARNQRWRVRAAAIDAIGTAIGADGPLWGLYDPFGEGVRLVKAVPVAELDPVESAVVRSVLDATRDEDPFVVQRALVLFPKIISESTVAVVGQYLVEHPDLVASLGEGLSEDERKEDFALLVWQAEKWLKQQDVDRTPVAVAIIAKLDPVRLKERIVDLLDSDDQDTRIMVMQAMLVSFKEYRESQLEIELRRLRTRTRRDPTADRVEAWYRVPRSFLSIPPKRVASKDDDQKDDDNETLAAGTSNNPDPDGVDTSEALGALDTFFGDVVDIDQSTQQAGEVPTSANESTANVNVAENGTTADSGAPIQAAFDLAISVFGTIPVSSATRVEGDQRPTHDHPDAGKAPESAGGLALASRWLLAWQDDGRTQPKWIQEISQRLRKRFDEMVDDPNIGTSERQWTGAALLAAGYPEFAEQLPSEAGASPRRETASPLPPQLDDLLPWLPPRMRLERLRQASIPWGSSGSDEFKRLLTAATEIDDLAIASWIFENWENGQLKEKGLIDARHYLLRSLVGARAKNQAAWVLVDNLASNDSPFADFRTALIYPGTSEAVRWIRDRWGGEQDAARQAWLLTTLSYLDHRLATQNAVGLVNGAKEDNILTRVALVVALTDRSEVSADRAAQWLSHHQKSVRAEAAKRLIVTSSRYMAVTSGLGVAGIYNSDALPGLWCLRREIPVQSVRELLESDDENVVAAARILLVSAGEEIPLSRLSDDSDTRLAVMAALVKAGRTDDEAIAYYSRASQLATDYREPAVLYRLLKQVDHPAAAKLRKEMRKRHGADVITRF